MEIEHIKDAVWIAYVNGEDLSDMKLIGPMESNTALSLVFELAKVGDFGTMLLLSAELIIRKKGENGTKEI